MSGVSEKPTPPADYECCESGCSPCVWDRYYEALQRWQTQSRPSPESDTGQG